MSATAANLIERVLPPSTALRQWVLTFPFSWRPRLAQDGELLGRLTQIFVDTVQAFYVRRAAQEGAIGAKTGAVTAVQRTSSDLRLNPHLHTIALDGAWHEQGSDLLFAGLGHLRTSEVGDVLERAVRRIERHLRRYGLLGTRGDDLDLSGEGDPESNLASSAVSGQSPPAGPQSPKGRLRAGRVAFGSSCTRSPTTSRSARRLMGSLCTRPARSLPSGDPRGRARRRGSRGAAALRPAWPEDFLQRVKGIWGASLPRAA